MNRPTSGWPARTPQERIFWTTGVARRAAADHFIRAAEIAIERGHVRYTHEISRALVALNDGRRLESVFARLLVVARQGSGDDLYLTLVDYADGLVRLGRPGAADLFEEAIRIHPSNNVEAINRYAQHLLDRGDAEQALDVLDRMSREQRVMNGAAVFLRKEALQRLGRDTSSADAEADLIRHPGSDVQGGVPAPHLVH